MVLDKEELRLVVAAVTSTLEVRRPLDEAEIDQFTEALKEFYAKLGEWTG